MRSALFIFLFILLIHIISCTKENPLDNSNNLVTPSNRHTEELSGNIYPHNSSFSFLHGKYYQKNKDACLKCHRPNQEIDDTKTSCYKCHKAFHPDLKRPKRHGDLFMRDQQACLQCHRPTSNGDLEGGQCQKCHNYPHPKSWAQGDRHGQNFLTDTKGISCIKCHQKNSSLSQNHPDKISDCGKCHISIPHHDDFKDGDHAQAASKYEGACTRCHTNYNTLMPNVESCFTCHEGSSEVRAQWVLPSEIGQAQYKKNILKKATATQKTNQLKKRRALSSKKK